MSTKRKAAVKRPNKHSNHLSSLDSRPTDDKENVFFKTAGAGFMNRRSSVDDRRHCPEHSFLTDVADVREMEEGLMELLDDFHAGKLQAFGEPSAFEKMDRVREQQEHLARLHFQLDSQRDVKGLESHDSRDEADTNLSSMMENLQQLCTSIQALQMEHPGTSAT